MAKEEKQGYVYILTNPSFREDWMKIGKASCTVSKWCQNSIQPDMQTLDIIARLLDVDKRDLLTPNK